jgi:hypothetical protein
MALPFTGGLVTFLVSLLVGGLGIYVGAKVVVGDESVGHALVTAVVGSLVWGLVALFLGGVPVVGWVLPLVAWVAVIAWRYDASWTEAAVVGVVAWLVASVALLVLPVPAVRDVIGIPFV